MEKKHRWVVTSAYTILGSDALEYLGSCSNKADAYYMASRVHDRGGRALVHDLQTGLIVRDTGTCLGQVWGFPRRTGQRSPKWESR